MYILVHLALATVKWNLVPKGSTVNMTIIKINVSRKISYERERPTETGKLVYHWGICHKAANEVPLKPVKFTKPFNLTVDELMSNDWAHVLGDDAWTPR